MRQRRRTMLGLLLGCAGALVAQEPAEKGVAGRILEVRDRLPEKERLPLDVDHLEALEQVAEMLPPALDTSVHQALRNVIHRASKMLIAGPQAEAMHPRIVSWCERLARHPDLDAEDLALLDYMAAESHFAVGARDEAVARFHRCAQRSSRLAFVAHGRAFRVELGRQSFGAAAAELAAAEALIPEPRPLDAGSALNALRAQHMAAHLALRIGLFDKAARTLTRTGSELTAVPGVIAWDREQQLLLTTELGFNRQDYELAETAALALQKTPKAAASTVLMARQRELEARIGRGGEVSLAELQATLQAAEPRNRTGPALALVRHALHLGAEDIAGATAANLLAGRPLADPTVTPETLLAAGCYELRRGHGPAADSPRLGEWQEALDQTWRRLLSEWNNIEVEAESLAFLQMPQRRDILGLWLRTRMGATDGPRVCFDRYLEADAMGSLARQRGSRALRTDEVLTELVPPNGALLVFLPGALGSHALWLAHEGARVFELPPEGRLREHVFALRRALASEHAAMDDGALRALAMPIAALVSSPELLSQMAGMQTLLVAGYDLLHGFPLELLPIDGAEGWLGLRHPICYLPSITLAMEMIRRPRLPTLPVAHLLAGTHLGQTDVERWGQVPVAASASALRGALATVAAPCVDLHRDATRADLAPGAGSPGLLAVVAHGIFDGDRPCPAGFLLAPEDGADTGAVFASDLPRQNLPAVAFLGVCGATRSALRLGEDGGHRLSIQLLARGSDAVVATDTAVRADEVLALLDRFTGGLVAGADVAQALLAARRGLQATGAHPRIWATMRLEGLPTTRIELPVAARGDQTTMTVIGIVTILLAGGAWWVMRARATPQQRR